MQSSKIPTYSLLLLSAVALTGVFIFTKSVLVPFVLSLFAYAIISVLSTYMQMRFKIPRTASYFVILGLFFLLSTLLFLLIGSSINNFAEGWVQYREQLVAFIGTIESTALGFGYELDAQQIRQEIRNLPVFSYIKGITGGAFSIVGNAFLIFIFLVFLLAGESKGAQRNPLIETINQKIAKYIIAKFSVSMVTGVLVGLLLLICGVDLAFMFAVVTVLLNFIPNIGSIIATLLPIPIVLLQFGLGWQFPVVMILSASIQIVIGNIIEPKLMGESMDLHPVSILIFLMFWGLVWGLPGMFMAVPLTAVLKIILDRLDSTKPFAEVLAGRLPRG